MLKKYELCHELFFFWGGVGLDLEVLLALKLGIVFRVWISVRFSQRKDENELFAHFCQLI
jgi:hypothetical protein